MPFNQEFVKQGNKQLNVYPFCYLFQVERLRMGQDSKTGGQGLYVESIEIDPDGGESVIFPCQCWSEEDDLKSQKDFYPEPEYPSGPRASKSEIICSHIETTFEQSAFTKLIEQLVAGLLQ